MEYLPTLETFNLWISQYGGIALFGLLALEIIALPIPGEPLMILTGVMLFKGELSLLPTLLAACAGSVVGISISYLIGCRAGLSLIKKYGSKVGLTEAKLQRAHDWFARFGKWTLFVGYFIPGLRHFTGLCAGISTLEFRDFAIFAYSGALIWVTTFLSVGYFFGNHWLSFFETLAATLG
jgi:membrane protein DedA with SNARE-associated domain